MLADSRFTGSFLTGLFFLEGMDMRKIVSTGYFLFTRLYIFSLEKLSSSEWEKEELSYKGSGQN